MTDPILAALENELNGSSPPPEKKQKRKTIQYTPPDPGDDPYEEKAVTLQQKKTEEEVRKLKIGNEKELKNLVERKLVKAILGQIGQSFKNHVVDQAKRKAYQWAAELEIPEKERAIEKLISDLGEEEINGVISDIKKMMDDGVFS